MEYFRNPTREKPREWKSKDALLKRARDFLADTAIKDAPLEQKTSFLASKGLSSAEIEMVLKELNPESTQSCEPAGSQDTKPTAPLIAYPEHPPPQPPNRRLSFRNVLFALYLSAGTAAVVYAAVQWIFAPMLVQLTAARRDLHQHTLKRIGCFIEQLKTATEKTATVQTPTELKTQDTAVVADSNTAQLLSQITCKISDIRQSPPTYVLNELSFAADEFKNYLNGLMYPPNFNFSSYTLYPGSTGKPDKATQVKNEIRSIKGTIINMWDLQVYATANSRRNFSLTR
ncbi:Peroxisomal membrane protein PEX14 [Neolecta irregularis DAH-3]|uniref:Peroxisomal membrane protein PEX14 n=1 Tax=Neolecta irregularis (strain DAH-3) TaxID=1198029 RepID=A0A1U7LMR7_NEOID|nr:Peroxisomal membrane protein PEX14 [Neolecta irregularis DAH-3]|eukprot:OLL23937.1 Peroxisomal membrane protein PEX14 [Neolecta irregularis DAH-3]